MDGPEGTAKTPEEIMDVATEYYKNLLKFESRPDINIDQEFFSREEKVSAEENDILEEVFSEQEIKKVVFESYPEGGLALMGYLFYFISRFWILLKVIF
jgi:hypothetical protein